MRLPMPASRRGFLATLAAPAFLRAQNTARRVRIAYIGVGNRGSYTMSKIMDVDGVDIAAVCDLDEEALKRADAAARGKNHTPKLYTDYRKMLEEMKDVDGVVIATPVDTHLAITLAALEAGKNVYCEKPMALNEQECLVVEKATESAKGFYQAGFQLRHDPRRAASMAYLKSGALGRVLFCQGYRHGSDLPRNITWLFDRKRSGDNIVEQACHILDLFTWAIDKPPLRAMGSGGISLYKDVPPGRTTMDHYAVIYEFPDDVRVCFSHLYFDPPGFSGIKERVFGSEGAIELPAAKWMKLGQRGEHLLEVADASQSPDFLSMKAFADNIREGKHPLNDAASARRSTLVAILGRKAIYEKRVVEWKEIAG
jgi:myo-inositol 2-dehydrogenase/D-chiro-inositol 1-dehydrogenase